MGGVHKFGHWVDEGEWSVGLLATLATSYLKQRSTRDRATRMLLPSWQYGREYVVGGDMQSMIRAYQSWVYICANKNAVSVAQQPLRLYATKGKNQKFIVPTKAVSADTMKYLRSNAGLQSYIQKSSEVEEVLQHPFLDLMKNVNPFSNRFALLELTDLYLELTGNAYWYIVMNGMNTPEEIWILPSQNMKIVPDPTEFIHGYVYTVGMIKEPYETKEIIQFKFPSPSSPYYGMSPLTAIAHAYNINENMNVYENAMFTNMGRLDGTLETDESISDDDFERINTEWKEKFGGVHKAGQTALLDRGLHYKTISLPPKDLSFLTGRRITKEEIAAAYGVPISKLTTEDVNRANAEAGNYSYMVDTIQPRCQRIEEEINERLMPMYADNLFVAFDSPVPEDREFRLKEREANIKSNYSSINLERTRDGQETVPWGEIPLVGPGITPLGMNSEVSDDPEEPEKEKKNRVKRAWY